MALPLKLRTKEGNPAWRKKFLRVLRGSLSQGGRALRHDSGAGAAAGLKGPVRTTLSPAEKQCFGTWHINHLATYFDSLLILYPMRGKITIKYAPCNAQAHTDTLYRARAGCVELQRHLKRLGIDGF